MHKFGVTSSTGIRLPRMRKRCKCDTVHESQARWTNYPEQCRLNSENGFAVEQRLRSWKRGPRDRDGEEILRTVIEDDVWAFVQM